MATPEKFTPDHAIVDKTSPSTEVGIPEGFENVQERTLKKVTSL
jgi:hypothetical protein